MIAKVITCYDHGTTFTIQLYNYYTHIQKVVYSDDGVLLGSKYTEGCERIDS